MFEYIAGCEIFSMSYLQGRPYRISSGNLVFFINSAHLGLPDCISQVLDVFHAFQGVVCALDSFMFSSFNALSGFVVV